MAQANSNAQREPSMEEILASIRRIIEDSDAANAAPVAKQTPETAAEPRKAEPAAGQAHESRADELTTGEREKAPTLEDVAREIASGDRDETAAEEQPEAANAGSLADVLREVSARNSAALDPATSDDESGAGETGGAEADDVEVRSFRDELADDASADIDAAMDDGTNEIEARPAYESRDRDVPMNALSMADIEAEVARQSDPQEEENVFAEAGDAAEEDEVAVEAVEAGSLEGETDDMLADDEAFDERGSFASEDESDERSDDDDYQDDGDGAHAVASSVHDRGVSHAAGAPAMMLDTSAAREQLSARAPIISEQAGRQVAAAFDELSEAFSHTKKFDEMAEEMMRPMLQDWLDNNLPILVERLVREEIDRVARGASR